ncbi:MAG: hypothetical protein Q8M01_08035 [Rubrivivax sp.]|nr:hypothetical protein [Rubrivivax sp.]
MPMPMPMPRTCQRSLWSLLLGTVSSAVLAFGSGQGVRNSPHDFATDPWNGRNEICRVCHVPHDHGQAAQRYLNGLLWNHAVSSATYTMYDVAWSSTIGGAQSVQPDGHSKLCLGCHDGTVGIDSFDKYAGGAWFMDDYNPLFKVPAFADGGNLDVRGTHPISIAFPAGETGDGKNFTDPTVATWNNGDSVASTLENGRLQCSTCHDVHDQDSVAGTRLLRTAQTVSAGGVASGMCLTCHVK